MDCNESVSGNETNDGKRTDDDQPTNQTTDCNTIADGWQPQCWDCERRMPRRALNPTPVHIDHEEGIGYDIVDVPLCRGCRFERLPTHACEHCGEEHLHLDRAVECCQHRRGAPLPDGGMDADGDTSWRRRLDASEGEHETFYSVDIQAAAYPAEVACFRGLLEEHDYRVSVNLARGKIRIDGPAEGGEE